MRIGVLDLQGDVSEHMEAMSKALKNLSMAGEVLKIKKPDALSALNGLIIPGAESTTLWKLLLSTGIGARIADEAAKGLALFGTCAGMITLAKEITDPIHGQAPLGLMDVRVRRNAFGRQLDSFETDLETSLGKIRAVFIRAPIIESAWSTVEIMAEIELGAVAAKQGSMLATAFHPELSTTLFHEEFAKGIMQLQPSEYGSTTQ